MSKAEVLRLRIDSNLKKEASEAAEALGLTISQLPRPKGRGLKKPLVD